MERQVRLRIVKPNFDQNHVIDEVKQVHLAYIYENL